ncbi:MAG: lysophospholipase [Clostridiales bacterium]|nr:lysophospholipase [Clostridiales bacterium]
MQVFVRERRFVSATGVCDVRCRVWAPEEPCGALQLTHGLCEQLERYEALAQYLAANGWLCYGMDNPGHGKSQRAGQPASYFGDAGGWDALIADMATLRNLILSDYPALPAVLLGQGFGSLLARSYAARRGGDFHGYAFFGTAGGGFLRYRVARMQLAKQIKAGRGMGTADELFRKYTERFEKSVPGATTPFCWLSRDEGAVLEYLGDPLCGKVPTVYALRDVLDGLLEVSDARWAQRQSRRPVYLASGACDPIGRAGRGVLQVERWLLKAKRRVSLKLYPLARHDILHETIRDTVFADLLLFLESVAVLGEYGN